jgi:type IX secretion system PorP/SprF family membrane protein
MFNTLALNPAYAGSRDVLSLTALGRYQWLERNVPGSPTTHSFTLDMPIKNEKMGIGIIAYNDKIGVSDNTGLNLAYSYRFKVGARTTMSLGLQPTVTNVSLALSRVSNLVSLNDPIFNGGDITKFMFNAGLGMFISNDKSYLGISVPQIIEQKIGTSDNGVFLRRHYFAMMGFVVGKGNFKIKPSTMIRYTFGTNLGVDGNVNFWYKDKVSLGISGRKSQVVLSGQDNIDAIVGMFELQLNPQLRLGYAYDYNNNRLNTRSENSPLYNKLVGTPTHEWLLRYEFGYGKSKILTPRYF